MRVRKMMTNYKLVLEPKKFTNRYPKFFACADTETNEDGRAVIFSIVGKNRYGKYIEYVKENHNYLELEREIKDVLKSFTTVYFHYLEFDLNAIFGSCWLTEFKTIFRPCGALITKLTNKTKLVDSTAILPRPLAKLGEMVGMEKIKIKNKNYINKEYCLQDSRVLYNVLQEFFKVLKENKIPFGYTLPTIFIKFLQTKLKTEVHKIDSEKDLKNCRKAYYGGRNEIYKIGKHKKVYIYDINSLYPYAMKNMRLAVPHKFTSEKKLLDDKFQILYCKVYVPRETYIPTLCIRYDKKLIFGTGYIVGWFTNWEIKHAIEKDNAKIIEIYKAYNFAYYDKNLLAETIDALYCLRKNSKTEAEKFIFKIILNGGYGKFAQWKFKTVYNKETNLLEKEETNIKYFANQIWSIQTTSYARIYLHKFLLLYKDSLVYTDTDCLQLTKKIHTEYIGNELGLFKLESCGSAEYKQCKVYRVGDKYKFKGVPKTYQKEAFENEKVFFKRANKMRSHLRYGRNLNVFETVKKQMITKYDKRVINNFSSNAIYFKNGELK